MARDDPAYLGVVSGVCEELVASTVDAMATEVVHSYMEDIVRE